MTGLPVGKSSKLTSGASSKSRLDRVFAPYALNAACRTFHVGKNSIKRWLSRLGGLKETLLLYALCHQFIQLLVEEDELYTKVAETKPAHLSEGWTPQLRQRIDKFHECA